MRSSPRHRGRDRVLAAAAAAGALALLGVTVPTAGAASPGHAAARAHTTAIPRSVQLTPEGLPRGAIKHVWLIILENKSYDATFTGLNGNSYLWKTLPSQGVLLKNYYGTGHYSMDNYLSLVSGQAPSPDVQNDCSTVGQMMGPDSRIQTTGTVDGNLGQMQVLGGPNAPTNSAGCVEPARVPTLFNQLNAVGKSWKGYAQDLTGAQPSYGTPAYTGGAFRTDTVPGREDGACGYPGASAANPATNPTDLVAPSGDVRSYTGAQPAQTTSSGADLPADQYVAKHFPFPWFAGLTGAQADGGSATYPANAPAGTPTTSVALDRAGAINEPAGGSNCDANHVANLDSPTNGLVHDLLHESTTPAFSWITPDNCSDAHDATCQGNNLSGAFNTDGTPNYDPSAGGTADCATAADPQGTCAGTGIPPFDPEATVARNYTGGLYASDLFLQYYIPLIERSAAFKDGGLIDVTFDESNPPFTYSGNSFNNAIPSGPGAPADAALAQQLAPHASGVFGQYSILSDAAGQTVDGATQHTQPQGPNSTLQADPSTGIQQEPGDGFNAFVDRPAKCAAGQTPTASSPCVADLGGGNTSPHARTDAVIGSAGSSIVEDPSIQADDTGREVTLPAGYTGTVPAGGVFVGTVTDDGPIYLITNSGKPYEGRFQLVDDQGNPVGLAAPVSSLTVSAEGTSADLSAVSGPITVDPNYDALDPTPGGGDTGSVLISPYIRPGTSTMTYYNHYSWLRTMEDLLGVTACTGTSSDVTLPAGTVCGGLDGRGHLGFAAQPGLQPFGPDVFTNARAAHAGPDRAAGTAASTHRHGDLAGGLLAVATYLRRIL